MTIEDRANGRIIIKTARQRALNKPGRVVRQDEEPFQVFRSPGQQSVYRRFLLQSPTEGPILRRMKPYINFQGAGVSITDQPAPKGEYEVESKNPFLEILGLSKVFPLYATVQ